MHLQLFIRAAILAVLVVLATSQDCSYNDQEGYIINIHKSERNGAVFMSDMDNMTRESCQRACCEAEEERLDDGSIAWCNLAVYHNASREKKSKNCFLVFCPSKSSCQFTPLRGFISSYVTETFVQETTDPEETTRSSTLFAENDSTLSPGTEESTPTPYSTSPSKTTPSIPASIFMDYHNSSSINNLNDTDSSDDIAADVDSGNEQDSSTYHVNASTGALIAAVCFGVIFLLAVMVVLGKHWYEAYQRRHYSKVDYLINGMYN